MLGVEIKSLRTDYYDYSECRGHFRAGHMAIVLSRRFSISFSILWPLISSVAFECILLYRRSQRVIDVGYSTFV